MIQIKQYGIVTADKTKIRKLQAEFANTNCLFLPAFIDKSLVRLLLDKISMTKFMTKLELDENEEFGRVLFVPETEPAIFLFHFLLNNENLFQLIQDVTNCEPVGNFNGRIHKSVAGEKHSIEWHGDNAHHRLIGLTVNFSTEKFIGAKFQLREKDSKTILREFGEISAGDAFLFRIAPHLQHRLTPLERGGDRTVGVGWFCSQPSREDFAKTFFRMS